VLEVPGGDDVFLSGDRVYLIGVAGRRAGRWSAMFSRTRAARRVCIVGGGVVGKSLARELLSARAQGHAHREATARAAEEHQRGARAGIDVVHGDGTHQGLLEEEEVDVLRPVLRRDAGWTRST
jgi:Trk K+ transport system NAD-binding subunit